MNHHVISSGNPDPRNYLERWIGLQQEFDLRKARTESGKDIEMQVRPFAVRTPDDEPVPKVTEAFG